MKRNIFVENYLLCGGIITGIFTFMGAIPFAIGSAAITGVLIKDALDKEKKKEEYFVKSEENREENFKRSEEWYQIEKIIKALDYFDPSYPRFIEQEKIENLFKNARIISTNLTKELDGFSYDNCNNILKIEELINMANSVEDKDKIVSTMIKDYTTSYEIWKKEDYIIRMNKEYYIYTYRYFYPNHFRQRCERLGIEFREYHWSEVDELRKKLFKRHFGK